MMSKPRTEEHKRKIVESFKKSNQSMEKKDGTCTGCGRKGLKAEPGARQDRRHFKHCGIRSKPGDECSKCEVVGKALQHTRVCGYYR